MFFSSGNVLELSFLLFACDLLPCGSRDGISAGAAGIHGGRFHDLLYHDGMPFTTTDMILIPVGMAAVCVCSSYTYIHIALHYLSLATYPLKRAVHDERSTMRQIVFPPLLYIQT
jgi:hypothetical protein